MVLNLVVATSTLGNECVCTGMHLNTLDSNLTKILPNWWSVGVFVAYPVSKVERKAMIGNKCAFLCEKCSIYVFN